MERLLEYALRHPFLTGGTALMALVVLAYEASRARNGGGTVGATDAVRLLNEGALLLDVRSKDEFDSGHVIEARHIPQPELAQGLESLKKHKDKVVITVCESGMRSGAAARVLRAAGFSKVVNLRGGMQSWRADSLPVVKSERKGK
jgi:rhodanese-related sulfurtransferase